MKEKLICEFCGKAISKAVKDKIKKEIGSKGGRATVSKYGKGYMNDLAKKGGRESAKKRWGNK